MVDEKEVKLDLSKRVLNKEERYMVGEGFLFVINVYSVNSSKLEEECLEEEKRYLKLFGEVKCCKAYDRYGKLLDESRWKAIYVKDPKKEGDDKFSAKLKEIKNSNSTTENFRIELVTRDGKICGYEFKQLGL